MPQLTTYRIDGGWGEASEGLAIGLRYAALATDMGTRKAAKRGSQLTGTGLREDGQSTVAYEREIVHGFVMPGSADVN